MTKLYKRLPQTYHRFLDESGDTTFFGKGRSVIVGQDGVSRTFSIASVRFKQDLGVLRDKIRALGNSVAKDPYFADVPSVRGRAAAGEFYFHAKDDVPEGCKVFFDFLRNEARFSFEAVVGRKIPDLFLSKHNGRENEFYADLLSHLLKSKMWKNTTMVAITTAPIIP